MDSSSSDEVAHDFPPFIKVYKDGRTERYQPIGFVPPEPDRLDGVRSKDAEFSPETRLKARIFVPSGIGADRKLPLLVHYHGGGFCIGSAFDSFTYNFLSALVAHTDLVAVSIDYRLAPEHPLPSIYEDSWGGLQWIASHSSGHGPEPWLNDHADLSRVFLTGESAGANIANHMAVRAGTSGLPGLDILGTILVHPYFAREHDGLLKCLCPENLSFETDPRLNPGSDPNLEAMACGRVMVSVAEKDFLRERGLAYKEILEKRGWKGKVEFHETLGEDHCFHFWSPGNENAKAMICRIAEFINQR